jgi:hypothetical protein
MKTNMAIPVPHMTIPTAIPRRRTNQFVMIMVLGIQEALHVPMEVSKP